MVEAYQRFLTYTSSLSMKESPKRVHIHMPDHCQLLMRLNLTGTDHGWVAESLVKAAEALGFFYVVNYGFSVELLEDLKSAAHQFFNQPAAKKKDYMRGASSSPFTNYGTSFVPEKEKTFQWMDYCSMAYTNDIDALSFWPDHYKLEEDGDVGKKGEWMEVSPVPGALLVNIGDTLQILSNGRYRSAEHRVRAPSLQSRVSIPCFCNPPEAHMIGPLPQLAEKYGGTIFGECLFEDYKNYFFGRAFKGKETLDFATEVHPQRKENKIVEPSTKLVVLGYLLIILALPQLLKPPTQSNTCYFDKLLSKFLNDLSIFL